MKKMVFLGCLILFFAPMVWAQEKIEAPVWNIGDKWDFGQEGFLEVVGIDKNGYVARFSAGIFLKSAQGKAIFDKSSFNVLYILEGDKAKKYKGAHRRILNFPLVIGKKWEDGFRLMTPQGFPHRDGIENIKVLGWEEVTVPAGKFRAIKMENMIKYEALGSGTLSESKVWYWYSPEVKYLVKVQYEKGYVEAVDPWVVSFEGGRKDWKLISFKLKK